MPIHSSFSNSAQRVELSVHRFYNGKHEFVLGVLAGDNLAVAFEFKKHLVQQAVEGFEPAKIAVD